MRLSYTQLQSTFEICRYHCILYLSVYQTVIHKSSNFVSICLIGVCLLSVIAANYSQALVVGVTDFKESLNVSLLTWNISITQYSPYFLLFKLQPNSATFRNLLHLLRLISLIYLRLDLLNSFKRKVISKTYPS